MLNLVKIRAALKRQGVTGGGWQTATRQIQRVVNLVGPGPSP